MMTMTSQSGVPVDFCSPVRNRYFYGKLLDVFHFELEQNYFNNKRWLLNRVVTGYGVVCGLNVSFGPDGQSVVVSPGVAIDKCGREIIVCQPSEPFPLPPPTTPPPATGTGTTSGTPTGGTAATGSQPAPPTPGNGPSMGGDCSDTGTYCHLCICYHECPTDPSPTLGGDCDCQPACTPGSIRERYCLKIVDSKLCPASTTSPLQGVINGGVLNYAALATYISTSKCLGPVEDCCIPLANISIPVSPNTYAQNPNAIDISVRPIVYTNDLLYDLMLAWMTPASSAQRGGK
jgi:hypothetical protein